jgi:hypothetical protein
VGYAEFRDKASAVTARNMYHGWTGWGRPLTVDLTNFSMAQLQAPGQKRQREEEGRHGV